VDDELVFKVAARRLRDISDEIPHPDVSTHFSLDPEGRGMIDIFFQGRLIGQEIIETSDSWMKGDRLSAYRTVLHKKIRLVVMAPRPDALKVRRMMLELNNWWMCNYMVFGYDSQGRLLRVLRPHPEAPEATYIG
jgi:hypothetical protein